MQAQCPTIALKALSALALLALIAGWFFLLWPASLGGPASYVIVAGRSMEPGLQMHDLTIVRRQSATTPGTSSPFGCRRAR